MDEWRWRVEQVKAGGVPNYFGAQRFGTQGRNLQRAEALLRGEIKGVKRHQRSLWLSAARSWLFNEVLAWRVTMGLWNRMMAGDVLQPDGARGQFMADADDPDVVQRFQEKRLHSTGPLYGKTGRCLQPEQEAANIENSVLSHYADWLQGLQRFGLQADRRALRCNVQDLQYAEEGGVLHLSFFLNKGCYATAMVRELVAVRSVM